MRCHPSEAQWGEERILFERIFDQRAHGSYVEIGAHNGIRFSNTLMLHTCYNWSGILVEADPDLFEALQR